MAKRRPKKQGKKRLREIASMKELSSNATSLVNLKQAMPVLSPFLKEFGAEVDKMEDALQGIDGMARQTSEFVSIPDRFNNFFADHGWIMYGMMNFEVAKEVVLKAEAGNFKEALDQIIQYYNVETIRFQIKRLNSIKAFRPRKELALKALIDYEEKRYHACVPVVLALTDGLVNELHEDHKGISAGSTQLEAWDSIAAHSQGLGKLVRIIRKGRRKTTTEPISLPYRNGILHGTDLSYDNEIVAAKTWALLFAVGEWAAKVERGETTAPEDKPEESFLDILEKVQEIENFKQEIESWKPRESISINHDLFIQGTPEYALNEFLGYWMQKNYGRMTMILPHKVFDTKTAPLKVREHFKSQLLISYEFVSVIDVGLSNTKVSVKLQVEEFGRRLEKSHDFVMICEDDQGNLVSPNATRSKWISYTWYV
ncbi:hypothetical protein [Paenibacillus luteus]|uniref:hypothetical protein n=1 Tax=Paenibacillus luteus TaxID=2545753 RepID=UPI00114501E2|nr:hypothetical protein [Paenibacillus luteus]